MFGARSPELEEMGFKYIMYYYSLPEFNQANWIEKIIGKLIHREYFLYSIYLFFDTSGKLVIIDTQQYNKIMSFEDFLKKVSKASRKKLLFHVNFFKENMK